MQINRGMIWTLVVATTGCAGPGGRGSLEMSQYPQHTQVASQQQAVPHSAQQPPGFSERIASTIFPGQTQNAAQANQQAAASAAAAARQKTDPISLGYASGAPNAELYLSMAQLSDQGGNPTHARSMYQRALQVQPNHLKALLALARLEDREGNLNEAIRIYQQAAGAHPTSAKALNDLALCYARGGQLAASNQTLQQAIRLEPGNPRYRNNVAKVLVELNRLDEAAGNLAAVHPKAVAQYNMGVLLHARGRLQEATQFLTAATQIDPKLQEAQTLLAQISSDPTRVVQNTPASNDHVLPTPMTSAKTANIGPNNIAFPSTGVPPVEPTRQPVPAETAQLPVSSEPMLLPPVRQ